MDKLPLPLHKLATLTNHFVEIIVPFTIFIPIRNVRLLGCFFMISFQIVLISVGNYSYLSYLTIAQVVSLLLLSRIFHKRFEKSKNVSTKVFFFL